MAGFVFQTASELILFGLVPVPLIVTTVYVLWRVVLLLKAAIEQEGSISALAKPHGIQRSYLSHVLNGKRPVSGPLVKALGLRKVYAPNS